MGLFDALFGGNTSAATQAATSAGQNGISSGIWNANTQLNKGAQKAADAFNTGAAGATDALTSAFGGARGDLLNFGGQAQGQLAAGRDAAVGTILGGNAGYQPFLSAGQGANTMLANALGLNGAAGNDAATAAFRADPGYAFTRDEGTDAVARKAAALGMAGSGNTMTAIQDRASSLADQTYGAWRTSLGDLASKGLTAASGISANDQAAGNIQYNAGSTGAQLSQGLGSSLSNLGAELGTSLAGVKSGLGSSLGGLYGGTGQQKASNIMGGALSSAGLGMQGAEFQDSAENANNAVFSNLLGSLGKLGAVATLNPNGLKL